MADNTQLNAGAGGDIIASDDIGGIKFQRVKVVWGDESIASDTTTTYPLPVSLTGSVVNAAITNTPNVNVANNPFIFATLSGTPTVLASMTGAWTVAVSNAPNVAVSNNPFVYATATEIGYKFTSETYTSVTGTTTSVTLVSTNTSRRGFTVFNDSTAVLLMKFGANVTTAQYKVKMAAGSFYEMPSDLVYTGLIAGVWGAATGSAVLADF